MRAAATELIGEPDLDVLFGFMGLVDREALCFAYGQSNRFRPDIPGLQSNSDRITLLYN